MPTKTFTLEFFKKQGRIGGKRAATNMTVEQLRMRATKASKKAAESMTPEQKRARAKKAVAAREAKRKKSSWRSKSMAR